MARWTVVDGEQELVIESAGPGLVSLDIPTGSPFVTDADHLKDIRAKLSLAIGDAQAGPSQQDDHGQRDSRGGEDRV